MSTIHNKNPIWFNLKKYTKDVSDRQFIFNIDTRVFILEFLENTNSNINNPLIFPLIKQCRKEGIIDLLSSRQIDYIETDSIKPLNVIDAVSIVRKIPVDVKKEADAMLPQFDDDMTRYPPVTFSNKPNIYTPVDVLYTPNATEIHIAVDVNAPPERIMEDFKQWLDKQRKLYQMAERVSTVEKKVNTWKEYQILPFMDLLIWEKETNIKIDGETYVAWLYPYGEKDINGFNRAKNYYKELIEHPEKINFLRQQIS